MEERIAPRQLSMAHTEGSCPQRDSRPQTALSPYRVLRSWSKSAAVRRPGTAGRTRGLTTIYERSAQAEAEVRAAGAEFDRRRRFARLAHTSIYGRIGAYRVVGVCNLWLCRRSRPARRPGTLWAISIGVCWTIRRSGVSWSNPFSGRGSCIGTQSADTARRADDLVAWTRVGPARQQRVPSVGGVSVGL